MAEQIREENRRKVTEGEAARLVEEARQRQDSDRAREVHEEAKEITEEAKKHEQAIEEVLDEFDYQQHIGEVVLAAEFVQKGGQ